MRRKKESDGNGRRKTRQKNRDVERKVIITEKREIEKYEENKKMISGQKKKKICRKKVMIMEVGRDEGKGGRKKKRSRKEKEDNE